jgi:predicted amino acid dehydrogenase
MTATASIPSDFALIGHPFDMDHLVRYLRHHKPGMKRPRRQLLLKLFEWTPPFAENQITMTSPGGRTVRGRLVICPLLPEMVDNGNRLRFRRLCIDKVIASLELALEHGALLSGLGGFTSIADGDQGRLVAAKVPGIQVTSGNTLTAMAAVDGVTAAAELLERDLSTATVTVVGATGDIGSACCRFLAGRVKRLVLVARMAFNQQALATELEGAGQAGVVIERDTIRAVGRADMVIAAASSVTPIFRQADFKPGAIVCDVGYPRNVFVDFEPSRSTIFLFSGGLLLAPSPVWLPFDMGLPDPHVLYGCWSEAVTLALAGRYESFSLGRGGISPEKMIRIWELAMENGFRRAPFFFGGKIWEDTDIARIRALR